MMMPEMVAAGVEVVVVLFLFGKAMKRDCTWCKYLPDASSHKRVGCILMDLAQFESAESARLVFLDERQDRLVWKHRTLLFHVWAMVEILLIGLKIKRKHRCTII